MAWQRDIDEKGLRRADIARRERLTRARVTQIMSLLNLPEDVKAGLLGGGEPRTIRGALQLAAST